MPKAIVQVNFKESTTEDMPISGVAIAAFASSLKHENDFITVSCDDGVVYFYPKQDVLSIVLRPVAD